MCVFWPINSSCFGGGDIQMRSLAIIKILQKFFKCFGYRQLSEYHNETTDVAISFFEFDGSVYRVKIEKVNPVTTNIIGVLKATPSR